MGLPTAHAMAETIACCHAYLDNAGVSPDGGIGCNEAGCVSNLAHRVHVLIAGRSSDILKAYANGRKDQQELDQQGKELDVYVGDHPGSDAPYSLILQVGMRRFDLSPLVGKLIHEIDKYQHMDELIVEDQRG